MKNKNVFLLFFAGGIKPLPKKATRNVTMAALLIEEVTRTLANEYVFTINFELKNIHFLGET